MVWSLIANVLGVKSWSNARTAEAKVESELPLASTSPTYQYLVKGNHTTTNLGVLDLQVLIIIRNLANVLWLRIADIFEDGSA